MLKFIAPSLATLLLLSACDTKVRQQRPPEIPEADENEAVAGGESDIAADPEVDETAIPIEIKKLTPEERRATCCGQCVAALANDRSGDAANKIPCADFTADLKNVCRKWFLDNPVMASEAKACSHSAPEDKAKSEDAPPNKK